MPHRVLNPIKRVMVLRSFSTAFSTANCGFCAAVEKLLARALAEQRVESASRRDQLSTTLSISCRLLTEPKDLNFGFSVGNSISKGGTHLEKAAFSVEEDLCCRGRLVLPRS